MSDISHLTESEFWNRLMHGIYGPRKGGARIIIDAEDAATGCGKTSLAVALARFLARTFDYELKEDDFTLSGQEYLARWREHPGTNQPSIIVLDELAGAGAGDARRSMSHQNVNLGRSWQLMRKKRIVTICTLPHWSDADKKMRRFADFRLWCLTKPIGYFRAYKVGADFGDGSTRTYRLDKHGHGRIKFPNLDRHNDPFKEMLDAKKDDLLDSNSFDADTVAADGGESVDPDEVRKDEKEAIAQRLRVDGMTTREVADAIGMSQTWVIEHTTNPDEINDTEATA